MLLFFLDESGILRVLDLNQGITIAHTLPLTNIISFHIDSSSQTIALLHRENEDCFALSACKTQNLFDSGQPALHLPNIDVTSWIQDPLKITVYCMTQSDSWFVFCF